MKIKSLLILAFFTTPFCLKAQNLTFSEVVTLDSVSQKAIYNRAKEWFVSSFNSGKDVIQLQNDEDGKLIGKGNFKFYGKPFTSGTNSTGPVSFLVTIETKDGKYRYTITDFTHSDFGVVPQEKPKGMFKVANRDVWNDSQKKAKEIIESIKAFMLGATDKKDW